jgi:Domain of unknown function (DUF4150)
MFAKTQMMGMSLGGPDVCLTPMPVPTPVPYPNIAIPPMGVPAVYKVLFMCAPAHNLATTVVMTNGDNAGVNLGVAAGTVMGPSRDLTGMFTCLVGGLPATRMTSISITNSTNAPGVTIAPSQLKVLLLGP